MNACAAILKYTTFAAVGGAKLRLSCLYIACVVSPGAYGQTLPNGLTVINGQANSSRNGSTLVIQNSNNAILNWQSFSIGEGATVRFDQPAQTSKVLNRVVGKDPSQILGTLASNGEVWLINQNGVVFGRNSIVDVAGIVASTLNISDAGWRAQQNLLFEGPSGSLASIANSGNIKTIRGGRVALVGGSGGIANDGSIAAPNGAIYAVTGNRILLADTSLPYMAFSVPVSGGSVQNLGQLMSSGGSIDVSSALITSSGTISTDAGGGDPTGGSIRLRATESLVLDGQSHTTANGGLGGSIELWGTDASVVGTVSATGTLGGGGTIQYSGSQVRVEGSALIDSSGARGGGIVNIGGAKPGSVFPLARADSVYLGPDTTIGANGTSDGSGGTIYVWGTQSAAIYGTLNARSGLKGGDGGYIETSGGHIDINPRRVATGSSVGHSGVWVVDPVNLLITDLTVLPQNLPSDVGAVDVSSIDIRVINSALDSTDLLLTTAQTTPSGTRAGNIEIQTPNNYGGPLRIAPTKPDGGHSLTIESINNLLVKNADIRISGDLNLSAIGAINIDNTATAPFRPLLQSQGKIQIESGAILTVGGPIVALSDVVLVGKDQLNFGPHGSAEARNIYLGGVARFTIGSSTVDIIGPPGKFLFEPPAPSRDPQDLLLRSTGGPASIIRFGSPSAPLGALTAGALNIDLTNGGHWEVYLDDLNRLSTPASSPAVSLGVIGQNSTFAPYIVDFQPTATRLNTVYYPGVKSSQEEPPVRKAAPRTPDSTPPLQPPTFTFGSTTSAEPAFAPVDVQKMTPSELTTLLDAREASKERMFGPGATRLQENQAISSPVSCNDISAALDGSCLVDNDDIRTRLHEYLAILREMNIDIKNLQEKGIWRQCEFTTQSLERLHCLPNKEMIAAWKQEHPERIKPRPVKYALVIGVDQFLDTELKKFTLQNARRDAEAVGRVLRTSFGFEVREIPNASNHDIWREINRLIGEASSDDTVLIYFAGHGYVYVARDPNTQKATMPEGYWLPSDANAKTGEGWVRNGDLEKALGLMQSNQISVISDSCFSGTLLGSSIQISPSLPDVPRPNLHGKSVTAMTAGRNEPVADSGDSRGHSVFTMRILDVLKSLRTWKKGSQLFSEVATPVANALRQRPQYAGLKNAGHAGPDTDFFFVSDFAK